jgi:hypothetical protein
LTFAVALAVAVLITATVTAFWRTGRAHDDVSRPSTMGDWAARAGMSPALVVGSRLAVEPGRGRRAVPVRSALVGAIAGVLGVVACFTFRAGIDDALAQPERSGIVWDSYMVKIAGPLDPDEARDVRTIPGARAVTDAEDPALDEVGADAHRPGPDRRAALRAAITAPLQPLEALDGHDEDGRAADLDLERIGHEELARLHDRRHRVHHLRSRVATVADDAEDLLELLVLHADEDGRVRLLEEAAGAVEPRRPVLALEERVDEDARVLVVDDGDDELHAAEYRPYDAPAETRRTSPPERPYEREAGRSSRRRPTEGGQDA